MKTFIENKELYDRIAYLQLGIEKSHKFFSTFSITQLDLSYMDDFEGNAYKIAGFSVFRSFDRTLY